METLKQNWKRYLISSGVSFATGFLIVFVAQIDSLTLESLRDGSLIGLLFVAVRAGLKSALEIILSILKECSKK
jgi:hypothetical protein